jgi:hypothetical protein
MGHTQTNNRHGLVVDARVTRVDGHGEREAAKIVIHDAPQAVEDPNVKITLGQTRDTMPGNSSRANR